MNILKEIIKFKDFSFELNEDNTQIELIGSINDEAFSIDKKVKKSEIEKYELLQDGLELLQNNSNADKELQFRAEIYIINFINDYLFSNQDQENKLTEYHYQVIEEWKESKKEEFIKKRVQAKEQNAAINHYDFESLFIESLNFYKSSHNFIYDIKNTDLLFTSYKSLSVSEIKMVNINDREMNNGMKNQQLTIIFKQEEISEPLEIKIRFNQQQTELFTDLQNGIKYLNGTKSIEDIKDKEEKEKIIIDIYKAQEFLKNELQKIYKKNQSTEFKEREEEVLKSELEQIDKEEEKKKQEYEDKNFMLKLISKFYPELEVLTDDDKDILAHQNIKIYIENLKKQLKIEKDLALKYFKLFEEASFVEFSYMAHKYLGVRNLIDQSGEFKDFNIQHAEISKKIEKIEKLSNTTVKEPKKVDKVMNNYGG
jgi:hypothetical protein